MYYTADSGYSSALWMSAAGHDTTQGRSRQAGADREEPPGRQCTALTPASPRLRTTSPTAPVLYSVGQDYHYGVPQAAANPARPCGGPTRPAPHSPFSPHNTSHDTISPERSSRVLHNKCGGGIIDLCRTLVVGGTNYAQVAVRPSSAQGPGAAVTPPHDAHVGEVVKTVDLMWWSSSPPRRHARGVSCPFWGPVSLTEVWSVPVLPAKESVTPWL